MAREDFNTSEPRDIPIFPDAPSTSPTLPANTLGLGTGALLSVSVNATKTDTPQINSNQSNEVTIVNALPDPTTVGVCCIPDANGTCLDSTTVGQDMTEEFCAQISGGAGAFIPDVTCEDRPCEPAPIELGACCSENRDTGLIECEDGIAKALCEARDGTWQGADSTCATSNCDDGVLRFSVDLSVDGDLSGDSPSGDFNFVPGVDTVRADLNVNTGQIVGDPIVRWYISNEHFPQTKPNIWNSSVVPPFGAGANMDVLDIPDMILGGTKSWFNCSDGFLSSDQRWIREDDPFTRDEAQAEYEAVTNKKIKDTIESNLGVEGGYNTEVVPNTYMNENTKGWLLLDVEAIANFGQIRFYTDERITWFVRGIMRRIVILREILPNVKIGLWRHAGSWSMANFVMEAANKDFLIAQHIENNVFASNVRYDPNGVINADGSASYIEEIAPNEEGFEFRTPADDHSQGKTLYEMLDYLSPVIYQKAPSNSSEDARVLAGGRTDGVKVVCDAIRAAHPDKPELPVVPVMAPRFEGANPPNDRSGQWAGEYNAFEMYNLKDYVNHFMFWYNPVIQLGNFEQTDKARLDANIQDEVDKRTVEESGGN